MTSTTTPLPSHAQPSDAEADNRRRLALAGYTVVGTALLFWLASWVPALSGLTQSVFALILGTGEQPLSQVALLNMTIFGGVMAGWGATIVGLSKPNLNTSAIGRAIWVGMVVWFVVDSSGSALVGAPRNVLLNTAFFALIAPPAWMMARRTPRLPVTGLGEG